MALAEGRRRRVHVNRKCRAVGGCPILVLEIIDELFDADETTTDLHSDQVASSNLNKHAFCAEPIVALRLADEKDLQLLPLGIVVEEVGECLVNFIALARDVNRRPLALDLVVELFDLLL